MSHPATGESVHWFTEGFTRYDQDRILQYAGLLTDKQYLDRLNVIVADYGSSPDRR